MWTALFWIMAAVGRDTILVSPAVDRELSAVVERGASAAFCATQVQDRVSAIAIAAVQPASAPIGPEPCPQGTLVLVRPVCALHIREMRTHRVIVLFCAEDRPSVWRLTPPPGQRT